LVFKGKKYISFREMAKITNEKGGFESRGLIGLALERKA
jgi:hypothetical protein